MKKKSPCKGLLLWDYFLLQIFLISQTIRNTQTITSANMIRNAAPPAATVTSTTVVAIIAMSAKIVIRIIIVPPKYKQLGNIPIIEVV